MKILMVAESVDRAGGAEEYLFAVSYGLIKKGHEIFVVYRRSPSDRLPYLVNTEGIKSLMIKDFNRGDFLSNLYQYNPDVINFQNVIDGSLLELVSRIKPTTVFIHNHESYCPGNSKYFFKSGEVCSLPASSICVINGYLKGCQTRRPLKSVRKVMEIRTRLNALGQVKKIICNSQYVKNNLVSNGIREESVTVNYLFPAASININSSTNKVKEEIPLVLYAGRLFKEKGIDHLLKALALLRCPFQAVIAGDGWEKENLIKLTGILGIGRQVKFLGFLSQESLSRLYRRASVVVVPSLWPEPFGMVGLEAFSFQLPVVAYASGGIPEWLEDGKSGFIVERGDIESLSNKIDTLLSDNPLAIRMGAYGREKIVKNFSLDQHLENLMAVYWQLCADWRQS